MTKIKNEFFPDYTVAPGEFVQEHLDLNGWSELEFAGKCELPLDTVSSVIEGTTRVTSLIATQFEKVLGVRACIWLRLEQMYQEGLENGLVPIGQNEARSMNKRPEEVRYSAIN